jgi:O-succinylbenzoic acid--CoA ligase
MLHVPTSTAPYLPDARTGEAYPFRQIWINGRRVTLDKIQDDREPVRSPFEETTFQFIREWLAGEETFSMNTSGSTGKPKSISISRAQMIASAQHTARKLNLQKHTRALVCIDTKYVAGKMMLVRALITGMRIMAVDPSANPLVRIPIDNCVQFTAFVPYQVTAILESKHPHLLNNLDKVLIGGAPLGERSREELARFQCECYETYGMTETVSHIALRLVNTAAKQPYFETLPGIDIGQDDRGCLVISADYLGEPVITNDLVEIVSPGKFLWLGRFDNVINTGGVKVLPEKIEKAMTTVFQKHNIDHRFFIAALADERLGHKVVLVIEGVQFSSESFVPALDDVRATLSPYEFPREVYTIPGFILTETQKVDRKKTLAAATFLFAPK